MFGLQCKCIDPKNQGGKPNKPTCKLPQYKGDGNCDDENNNKGCGYDGGDCCAKTVKGGKVQKDYCKMTGNGPTTQGSAALVLDRPVACCHMPGKHKNLWLSDLRVNVSNANAMCGIRARGRHKWQ